MKKHEYFSTSVFFLLCYLGFTSYTQESNDFKDERAEENYSFFKDSTKLAWQNAIKYISLSANRNSYLSIGGSYRPRFEHFSNKNWIADNDENYYSQRLSFHTDWHFGKNKISGRPRTRSSRGIHCYPLCCIQALPYVGFP